MKPRLRRIAILLVVAGILALNVYLFEPTVGACLVIALGDVAMGLMVVSAWHRIRQDEVDRANLEKVRRERTWE